MYMRYPGDEKTAAKLLREEDEHYVSLIAQCLQEQEELDRLIRTYEIQRRDIAKTLKELGE